MPDLRLGVRPAPSAVRCDQCGSPIPPNHRPQPVTRHDPKLGRYRAMKVCIACLRTADDEKDVPIYTRSKSYVPPVRVRVIDRNPRRAKVTAEQVLDIRRRWAAGGVTQLELAHEYGLNRLSIGHIIRRKSWAHLPEPGAIHTLEGSTV